MSCHEDSIYRTIEWLRGERCSGTSFRAAFADAWGRWARVRPRDVEIRVGLVNYKPFERGRVMADATFVPGRAGSMPVTLNLFIHIFADPESANREFEACAGKVVCCCYGPPVFRLENHRALVWVLPNAPNLLKVRELRDLERFSEFLAEAALAHSDPGAIRADVLDHCELSP